MTPLTLDSVVQRSTDQVSAPVNGEVTVMSIEQGKYYGLDDIAGDIWQQIEKPVSVRALCAALAEIYDAHLSIINRDVLTFLQKLINEGLVTASDG